jgi:hypothetical protein
MKAIQLGIRMPVVLCVALAVMTTSCETTTPQQTAAVWGGLAGAAMTGYRLAQGDSTGNALLKGAAVGAAVGATVLIIEKRKASERQRLEAQRKADEYMKLVSMNQRQPPSRRYLAVETDVDDRTKGEANVMIYDTNTHALVNTEVYDLKKEPANGAVATFERYDSVYVASN